VRHTTAGGDAENGRGTNVSWLAEMVSWIVARVQFEQAFPRFFVWEEKKLRKHEIRAATTS